MITQRTWWLGVTAVVLAILFHALVPRYEWQQDREIPIVWIRIDRWTGRVQIGALQHGTGTWQAAGTPGFQYPRPRE